MAIPPHGGKNFTWPGVTAISGGTACIADIVRIMACGQIADQHSEDPAYRVLNRVLESAFFAAFWKRRVQLMRRTS